MIRFEDLINMTWGDWMAVFALLFHLVCLIIVLIAGFKALKEFKNL